MYDNLSTITADDGQRVRNVGPRQANTTTPRYTLLATCTFCRSTAQIDPLGEYALLMMYCLSGSLWGVLLQTVQVFMSNILLAPFELLCIFVIYC